jgi:hypothetical protein
MKREYVTWLLVGEPRPLRHDLDRDLWSLTRTPAAAVIPAILRWGIACLVNGPYSGYVGEVGGWNKWQPWGAGQDFNDTSANAAFNVPFARRSSRTSYSNSLMRRESSVAVVGC